MRKLQNKNTLVLILLLIAGVVLGGFIGDLFGRVPSFSWLGYGKSFGITSPFVLDIGVLFYSLPLLLK